MLMITELLTPTPGPLWRLVKQAGIDHVVTLLDGGEQLWRWPEPGQEDGPPPFETPPRGGPGTVRRWPGCRRPTGNTGSSSR